MLHNVSRECGVTPAGLVSISRPVCSISTCFLQPFDNLFSSLTGWICCHLQHSMWTNGRTEVNYFQRGHVVVGKSQTEAFKREAVLVTVWRCAYMSCEGGMESTRWTPPLCHIVSHFEVLSDSVEQYWSTGAPNTKELTIGSYCLSLQNVKLDSRHLKYQSCLCHTVEQVTCVALATRKERVNGLYTMYCRPLVH